MVVERVSEAMNMVPVVFNFQSLQILYSTLHILISKVHLRNRNLLIFEVIHQNIFVNLQIVLKWLVDPLHRWIFHSIRISAPKACLLKHPELSWYLTDTTFHLQVLYRLPLFFTKISQPLFCTISTPFNIRKQDH